MLGITRAATGLDLPDLPPPAPATAARVECVDAARGLAVVGMLAANLVNVCFRDIPGPLGHNHGDVLRLFDLPAPIFQLLVGVSLPLFLAARRRAGRTAAQACAEAGRRFVLLLLLGMVLDGIGALSVAPRWGVLQTLGLGGLVALAVAGLPALVRMALALGLCGLHCGALDAAVHERPDAALAFVPLTLAGQLLGEALTARTPRRRFVREAAAMAVAAAALALVLRLGGVPFNKVVGSGSFVALATALGAATLALLAAVEVRGRSLPGWLPGVGRNALTAWVLLYVLVYYPAWLVFPEWSRLAPGTASLVVTATTAALCAATLGFGRRGIRIPL